MKRRVPSRPAVDVLRIALAIGAGVFVAQSGCAGPRALQPRNPTWLVLSTQCGEQQADLKAYQEGLKGELLGLQIPWLSPPSVELDPEISLHQLVGSQGVGWSLLFYSGHGYVDGKGASHYCLKQPNGVDDGSLTDLIAQLPQSLSGATVVVNACQSADVDVRSAKIPVSVLSASPYVVATRSLFGRAVLAALEEASDDPNCDGLVTDQELFDATARLLLRWFPLATSDAFPKLRRQATSHIPLPIQARAREECVALQKDIEGLASAGARSDWGELATALHAQLALRAPQPRTPPVELPAVKKDYYLLRASADDEQTRNSIAVAIAQIGHRLQRFPSSEQAVARQVARFATFAEVYEIQVECDTFRILRLRDDTLYSAGKVEELGHLLPEREMRTPGTEGRERLRIVGQPAPSGLAAIPCLEAEGQCFTIPATR